MLFFCVPMSNHQNSRTFRLKVSCFNPFNTELNPICHLMALLGAHHILHISRIRVKKESLYLILPQAVLFIFRLKNTLGYSYNKTNKCTFSQIYFWNRTLHVSDKFSVHHQESSTVYTAIDYVILLASGIRMEQQAVSITCMTYTYWCVYSTRFLMMDRKPIRNM
jgi:hypothetical protein